MPSQQLTATVAQQDLQKTESLAKQAESVAWTVGVRALEIILLFLAARLTIRIALSLLHRFLHSPAVKLDDRRRNTMASLLDNVIRYVIYFIFLLFALQATGAHIGALLAGAGIAGVALGFGAQNLIKDVLTGFFILFEDQYGVGDVVQINGSTGTVLSIGLRLTRIQAWTGEVTIIPNGQVLQVTNYSKYNAVAVIDVGVSYDTDIEHALEILKDVLNDVKAASEAAVGDPQILGVQQLRGSDILLRATMECKPGGQYNVQRLAQRLITKAYTRAGISIPLPMSVVVMKGPSDTGQKT